MREPFATQVQSSQRGARQGIECLAASAALVALQAIGMAISDRTRVPAMRTTGPYREAPFNEIHRRHPVLRRRQFRHHLLPLIVPQPDQHADQLRQLSLPHFALLDASAQPHRATSIQRQWLA